MIRHHHPGMQTVILAPALPDCASDYRSDIRHAEIQRTASPAIKEPVHTRERLPRGEGLGEILSSRQTVVQPEGNEQWIAVGVEVRQMAATDEHFSKEWAELDFSAILKERAEAHCKLKLTPQKCPKSRRKGCWFVQGWVSC